MNTGPTKGRFFSNKEGNWTIWDEIRRGNIFYERSCFSRDFVLTLQIQWINRFVDSTLSIREPRHLKGATIKPILGEWHVAKWEGGLCPLSSPSASLCGTFVFSMARSYQLTSVYTGYDESLEDTHDGWCHIE